MSDALWGAIGAVVGAAIGALATYQSQRQPQLTAEYRSAINDLKRFENLKIIWAEELFRLKPTSSPEAERRGLRGLLNDKIGQFGEPGRIDKLLDRLG